MTTISLPLFALLKPSSTAINPKSWLVAQEAVLSP
jgi:hypothetical protein